MFCAQAKQQASPHRVPDKEESTRFCGKTNVLRLTMDFMIAKVTRLASRP
jgi:hypothetical protein